MDRPRQPYIAERSGRYEGFLKFGFIVKMAHAIAVAEACLQIWSVKQCCQTNRSQGDVPLSSRSTEAACRNRNQSNHWEQQMPR